MKFQLILICALLLAGHPVAATEVARYELTLSDHRFEPAELTVPAGARIRLLVHNRDDSIEEFHSDALHTEKMIGPGKSGVIGIGPLAPGVYLFMGEFHADTALGRIIAR